MSCHVRQPYPVSWGSGVPYLCPFLTILMFSLIIWYLFVCVEVLRPSQPNGVMSSAVSLLNHTFTGQAKSSKRLISSVHILSPETDNCPSWISGGERMSVENISWSISTKECCRPRRGVEPAISWSTVGRHIQMSHRGWQFDTWGIFFLMWVFYYQGCPNKRSASSLVT